MARWTRALPAASFLALFALTALRLAGSTEGMDAGATHLTGRILRGPFDTFVSSLWFLGEPQLGTAAAVLLAAILAYRGRRLAAVLVLGSFGLATGLELGMRLSIGLLVTHHPTLGEALIHEFPSGHAARIPLLGGMVAALVPRPLRAPVLVGTIVLALLEALDRIDSTLQSASDVIGGLLLGTWLALCFALVLWRTERGTRPPVPTEPRVPDSG